jgi:hypothetical protein|tara:strand:+ start:705 stop:1028 length:324 start_codon:yes stop_codon:yes gene_type:complete
MKRLYSILHITLVAGTLLFCSLKGQVAPEVIPYRLIPSSDMHCPIDIEIVKPVTFDNMNKIYSYEVEEVIINRIVFETTNPFSQGEVFIVDDKYYFLLRIPYTGVQW